MKAHVNIQGNEEADQAAKEGASGGQHIKTVSTYTPWSQIKATVDEMINAEWASRWNSEQKFRHTKLFYSKPDKNKAKGIMKMSTLNSSTWIKGITGHDNVAYFKSLQDPSINLLCSA